jgi:hypothetical protein
VPVTDDAVEHAAPGHRAGRVLASPLAVAVGGATVEAGRCACRAARPRRRRGGRDPSCRRRPALQALTRSVVTDGTGTAVRDVPGEPVRGKTGTAEYGTDVPAAHPRLVRRLVRATWPSPSSSRTAASAADRGAAGGRAAARLR